MVYCPECGNKVSITDKRCSKCGTKLDIIDVPTPPSGGDIFGKLRKNIVFALVVIALVLSVFAISQSLNDYMIASTNVLLFICIIVLADVIGAILTRYYPKVGSIICLVAGIILIIFSVSDMFLAMVFNVIAVITAFILN